MISITKHKQPVVTLTNAIAGVQGVPQNPRGTIIEYWVGETDMEPTGARKQVFEAAHKLWVNGLCHLVQVSQGGGVYSYRAVVA